MSQVLGPAQDKCLRFYFYMGGSGSLAVKILSEEGDVTLIWQHVGSAGETWRGAQVDINMDVNFQVC